ncbi:hotdog fold thioesterase [Tsukamurella ocularis]|uniref:hotdog fold thioesterase n=1 Tax=Tsukamurella ocularis TaxID=1970234 RepID=UPI0035B670B4
MQLPGNVTTLLDNRGLTEGELYFALGIQIDEASATGGIASIPVSGNTQPYGLLHGGASIALAETIASLCAMLSCRQDQIAVGTRVEASHIRPARRGRATARAVMVARTESLRQYKVTVSDDSRHILSEVDIECRVLDARKPKGI